MIVPETEIIVTKDGAEILRKTVRPGDYVIGREAGCEVHLDVELVSRRHAQLTVNFDHALIEDLGSSNGTFVNGQPVIEPTRLWPNQKIQIGSATVELRRIKTVPPPNVSLSPQTAAMRRLLPEEFLREKKYDIGKVVAQGGMGAILDARDAATQRRVAMKVMLDGSSPDDLARFVAEARVTSQLEHPSIVPVHELGIDENGQPFYTMKMVRGITLRKVLELLAEGVPETVKKYPLPALFTNFQKVCDALAFAHSRGVIHRDLKPENIMLDDFGVVLVMDWGLAKVIGKRESSATGGADAIAASVRGADPKLGSTLAGSIMGTPQYMSPEQARGEVEDLDARSDIYALGAILYHILALRPPVTGQSAMEVVSKVAEGNVEPLSAPKDRNLPDSLVAVVRKAMAFDKAQRYGSVEELQRDLTAYQTGFATSAEKAGLARLFLLKLKRHKTVSIASALVLLATGGFGTRAFLDGRRAAKALADLKQSAPALLELGMSEAGSQRFPEALKNLDAALALDPALTGARWQRSWVLLGMERWNDAATALRLAQQRDSAAAKLASILPAVEKIAATPEAGRWKSNEARAIFRHLASIPALGPALAFSTRLKLGTEERRKLVEQRLLAALGRGNYFVSVDNEGLVSVSFTNKAIRSLEAMRGLPVDRLDATGLPISDLEPLRGSQLQSISFNSCQALSDLGPLRGMPLRWLDISGTQVRDIVPLTQAHLEYLNAYGVRIADLASLAGQPLTDLTVNGSDVSRIEALRGMPLRRLRIRGAPIADYSPLKGAPLQDLEIAGNLANLDFAKGMPLRALVVFGSVARIDALRGMPLERLDFRGSSPADLTPLQGAPLKDLSLRDFNKVTNFASILALPALERLTCNVLPPGLLPLRESETLQTIKADAYPGEGSQGARSVAEFWRAYDAHQKEGAK